METVLPILVTFLVIIDPIGTAPIFAALTEGASQRHRVRMAIKGTMISATILAGFAYGGSYLLGAMGISLDAFKAAGGILLFLIALEMVFDKRNERRGKTTDAYKESHAEAETDISVFPLSIPLLAGPGTITTIMLYMKGAGDDLTMQLTVLGAAGSVLLGTMLVLMAVGPIMRIVGNTVAQTIGRILGVILAALAVQLVFDAVAATFLA